MERERSIDELEGQSRLPKFAIPKRYDLKLTPDLIACTFAGTLELAVDVVAATRFLVPNAADLSIDSGSFRFRNQRSSEALCPLEIVKVEEDDILVLGFDGALPIGEGVLGLAFTGTLNDQMKGFYRSVYEYNVEKRNMAATQFESVVFSVLG